MKVITANTAGFCFGVRRAVDLVLEQCSAAGGNVYTYGPIIHNEQVVAGLEKRGVRVIEDLADLDTIKEGTIIIRSHGVSRAEQEIMDRSSLNVVDATCPYVKKIHRIVEKAGDEGRTVIIAGDPGHPEVRGIVGWTTGRAIVVNSAAEAASVQLEKGERIMLVAQTTFQAAKFEDIVEIYRKRGYYDFVINTVCSATDERQAEARDLARQVDVMIVVGGRHSSNTRKLYEICQEHCESTYLIETLDDLDLKPFQSFTCVGITAGASTPKSIIEEVTKHVRTKL